MRNASSALLRESFFSTGPAIWRRSCPWAAATPSEISAGPSWYRWVCSSR